MTPQALLGLAGELELDSGEAFYSFADDSPSAQGNNLYHACRLCTTAPWAEAAYDSPQGG